MALSKPTDFSIAMAWADMPTSAASISGSTAQKVDPLRVQGVWDLAGNESSVSASQLVFDPAHA